MDGKLLLEQVFQADAAEIIAAREKCRLIHGTKDIRAAGNEVEETVRRVVRRKLPKRFYVGHGHVIDSSWTTSKQLDIVIADNLGSPVLFQTEDGTEYLTYESVYAVGEIKSTYAKSEQFVEKFVKTTGHLRSELKREQTSPRFISTGMGQGFELGNNLFKSASDNYQNPLVTFMIFANSGDFQPADVQDLYKQTSKELLPSVICFLDKGLLLQAHYKVDSTHISDIQMVRLPELEPTIDGLSKGWLLAECPDPDHQLGRTFGLFYTILMMNLQRTVLKSSNIYEYTKAVFGPNFTQFYVFG